MQHLRKNFILSGWVCLILGTGVFFSEANDSLLIIGTTMSLSGIVLILIGINSNEQGLNPKEVADWKPSKNDLEEGENSSFENKRIKFRIDTTLDEPIKTSILCGNCSELTIVNNTKPNSFRCPKCKFELWDEEE
tara:strand:+ start:423 stop:827 length:405 start_codon:yes stop_codon:yes gene_type:complete